MRSFAQTRFCSMADLRPSLFLLLFFFSKAACRYRSRAFGEEVMHFRYTIRGCHDNCTVFVPLRDEETRRARCIYIYRWRVRKSQRFCEVSSLFECSHLEATHAGVQVLRDILIGVKKKKRKNFRVKNVGRKE